MCGIAGVMTRDGGPVASEIEERFKDSLSHRGPDGAGSYKENGLLLVQTRLAIIDLTGGDQPLFLENLASEAEPLVLVANGEIYNYIEWRETIGEDQFKTHSDCEVALHLFREYGPGFIDHLRGMYAIAVFDPATRKLTLARDPFGIKPLYYAETNRGFAFASEPRALIKGGFIEPALNAKSMAEVLQLQFSTGRETAYQGIKRVLPGEVLTVKNGRIVECRQNDYRTDGSVSRVSEDEALNTLDDVFTESVSLHQRSDVPYGMFFSGGIDSSALLAMMDRLNETPVKAFTVGFTDGDAHDERALAAALAKKVGAEFNSITFEQDDFWKLLPVAALAVDDPTADYAILPTLKLAAAAKDHGLKVILSGEGGDELFAGYGRYRRARRFRLFGGRPMRETGILSQLGLLKPTEPARLWRSGIEAEEARWQNSGLTPLQKAQFMDIADWLPNDLLTKLDRCLMHHGIEGRVPFLDSAMAAFALPLPDQLKVKGRTGKWLLRQWLSKAMPEADPFGKKRGFTVPVESWISKAGPRITEALERQAFVREFCDTSRLRALTSSNDKKVGKALWTLLFSALWYQQNILGRKIDGDPITALMDQPT